MKEDKN